VSAFLRTTMCHGRDPGSAGTAPTTFGITTRWSSTCSAPATIGMTRTSIFGAIGTHSWRAFPVDASELVDLLRHVATACFVVIAYLSGVGTGEALNLRRGCIRRESNLALTLMSGHQLKAEGPRRDRSPGTIPWVVTDETAHAVSVLEQITVSDLLFRVQALLRGPISLRRYPYEDTRLHQHRHRQLHRMVRP
jgi:hypothetical protein